MASDEKIRIVFYGSNPDATYGTSRVNREITKRLKKTGLFEIIFIAEDYWGVPYNNSYGMKVLPLGAHLRKNPKVLCQHVLQYFNQLKPHIFYIFTDAFLLYDTGMQNIDMSKSPTRKVGYFNLDSVTIPEGGNEINRWVDRILVSSHFTHDQYKLEGFESEVIWHGVDTKHFKKDDQVRKRMRSDLNLDEDDFVFLAMGRNSPRKNWGALFLAFSKICYEYGNMKLYVHMPERENFRLNWIDFINRTVTKFTKGRNPYADGKIIFSDTAKKMGHGCPEDHIKGLYAMADAYVTSTNGEGFGFGYAEAMASQLPVIAPDNTTTQELIGDKVEKEIGPRGWIVPTCTLHSVNMSAAHHIVDQEKLAEAMVKAYNCPKEVREQMGLNGKQFCDKHLNWDDIAKQFEEIFLEEFQRAVEKNEAIENNEAPKETGELSDKILTV